MDFLKHTYLQNCPRFSVKLLNLWDRLRVTYDSIADLRNYIIINVIAESKVFHIVKNK